MVYCSLYDVTHSDKPSPPWMATAVTLYVSPKSICNEGKNQANRWHLYSNHVSSDWRFHTAMAFLCFTVINDNAETRTHSKFSDISENKRKKIKAYYTCKYCCWSDVCGLQPPLLSTTPCRPLACGANRRATFGWLFEASDDEAVNAESGMALLCTPRVSVQPYREIELSS